MQPSDEIPSWDFSSAIDLLKTLSSPPPSFDLSERSRYLDPPLVLSQAKDEELSLGNFSKIWDFLSSSPNSGSRAKQYSLQEDAEHMAKEVRWRDEVSGADLEDNVDPEQHDIAAALRTKTRKERRLRARERTQKGASRQTGSLEAAPDSALDESGDELNRLRRSPDRRAVIQDILHRPSMHAVEPPSPPTSPSPPKESLRILRKEWPISNPFQWSASTSHASYNRNQVLPLGNLSQEQRKTKLISRLSEVFPSEAKYLKKKGLIHPEFTPLNTSDSGVHVFIDVSNVCCHHSVADGFFAKHYADHDRFPRLFEAFARHARLYTYQAGANVFSHFFTRP